MYSDGSIGYRTSVTIVIFSGVCIALDNKQKGGALSCRLIRK